MKVTAVIVTYLPALPVLGEIVGALSGQCDIVVADNSPTPDDARKIADSLASAPVTYLPMGADAALLLDDDSIPPPDLVARLVACATAAGPCVVVGANAVDHAGREISNARHLPGPYPACRDMMSSGALIRRSIFDDVGPFDEDLFIDGVDFDWGWRAQHMGIELRLCRAVAIRHRLGEGRVAGVRYPSPVRHYFQYRNNLRLMGRGHTPWRWRLAQSAKLTAKLALIAVLMPQKWTRFRFAGAGIRDAICGVKGPWPLPSKDAS